MSPEILHGLCGNWDVATGMWQLGCDNLDMTTGMWQLGCDNWNVATGMRQLEFGNWNVATDIWQQRCGNNLLYLLEGHRDVAIIKFAFMGKFRQPYIAVPILLPTTYYHFRPANIILQPQQPQRLNSLNLGWTGRASWGQLRPSLLSYTGWGWGRLRLRHSLLG